MQAYKAGAQCADLYREHGGDRHGIRFWLIRQRRKSFHQAGAYLGRRSNTVDQNNVRESVVNLNEFQRQVYREYARNWRELFARCFLDPAAYEQRPVYPLYLGGPNPARTTR